MEDKMGFLGELLEDITGKSKRPEIKGGRFEKFVFEEIFIDKLFDLVEMTRDFDSNLERFEERSMNPDFLFRLLFRTPKQDFFLIFSFVFIQIAVSLFTQHPAPSNLSLLKQPLEYALLHQIHQEVPIFSSYFSSRQL